MSHFWPDGYIYSLFYRITVEGNKIFSNSGECNPHRLCRCFDCPINRKAHGGTGLPDICPTHSFNGVLIGIIVFLQFSLSSFSQKKDSITSPFHVEGSIFLTTNGISTIPNFILGKPAAIFYLSAGRRISFEPEFRISYDAKPWMFIFWWRTYLLKTPKYTSRIGINAQINFNNMQVNNDGVISEVHTANRYLTADLSQSCIIAKNYSAGMYYMYSHTLEKSGLKALHYLAFRNSFQNIRLSEQFFMKFTPQVYYLRLDEHDGFYFTETLTLAKRGFPFSVSSIITNPIKTRILINNHLVWNINLIYSFNYNFVKN